jgi:large subunit ribosomal protein L38e
LPKQIYNEEDFLKYSEVAVHCRVKRIKDKVKLKLRTQKYLYTFKTDPATAERLLRSITCDVIEL